MIIKKHAVGSRFAKT